MNKKQFCSILQCALFSFDGISIEDMINRYGFRRSFAESGEELCNYLKTLKINEDIDPFNKWNPQEKSP